MGTTRIRTRIATSHPIDAYGGVQLPEEAMAQIAAAVASGSLPMHFQHDISRPVQIANIESGTERLDDGHLAAWAEFDVDEAVWADFQRQVTDASAPGGMSISFTSPLDGEESADDAAIVVAADASHFTQDEIRDVATALADLDGSSRGELLYQFSVLPEVKVVLEVAMSVVASVGPGILSAAIWDATKGLFRSKPKGIIFNFVFRETRRGTRKMQIHLEANTEQELRTALERLPTLLDSGASGTFASIAGQPLQPSESSPDSPPSIQGPPK